MLDFSDQPYHYFPPRRCAPIVWLFNTVNRLHYLPNVKRIEGVEVSGIDKLRAERRPSDRLMIMPNHPTHADPQTLFEALRQVGIKTQTMAAYDLFLRGRLERFVLQRSGTFSVDREGSDPKAMAEARRTLDRGRHALTIFPEGNVYLQNDRVTPFHEGAAMLGLRAARDLAKASEPGRVGPDSQPSIAPRILAVPVSMKYTYTTDVRDGVLDKLAELESLLEVESDANDDPAARIRRVGLAALHRNLKNRGIDPPQISGEHDTLPELIDAAASAVLEQLERKLDLSPRPNDALIDRVRKTRRAIHQVRIDPDRSHDHAAATTWADEAMLAFRIVSYTPTYVSEKPTLDRLAETVEKLAEDLFGKWCEPFGPRRAFVRFNQPIDLTGYLESFSDKARVAVRELTDDVEAAVQAGIDDLNEANGCAGAELMGGAG